MHACAGVCVGVRMSKSGHKSTDLAYYDLYFVAVCIVHEEVKYFLRVDGVSKVW